MKNVLLLIFSLAFLASHFSAKAQIAIPSVPFDYTQNFNSFGTNNVPWVNNNTLLGWYIVFSLDNMGTSPTASLFSDDGNNQIPLTLNYGSLGATDRALGTMNGLIGSHVDFYYGARFTNTTPFEINNLTITYRGEQWRENNVSPQTLRFLYRVGGTSFLANNTGWISLNLFDFVSPQFGATNVLIGNELSNRQLFSINSAAFPSPIVIPPNEEFWIRWAQVDGLTNGHGLAIDDVALIFSTNSPIVDPGTNSNTVFSLSDVQLTLKKPKLNKTLRFKGVKGLAFKAHIFATSSTVTKVFYTAFSTEGTNTLTNLVFVEAGSFKLAKGKLAEKGVKVVSKHKGNANKPGIGIAADTAFVTLIVKVDGTQGTNTGSAFFTNTFTSKVK